MSITFDAEVSVMYFSDDAALFSREGCQVFTMTYYFDVMPQHPHPEYPGLLTSYLMRLAAYNAISSMDGIAVQSFPRQDRRPLKVVEGMGRGDFQGRGATIQGYFKYAHYMCFSLK